MWLSWLGNRAGKSADYADLDLALTAQNSRLSKGNVEVLILSGLTNLRKLRIVLTRDDETA